MKILKHQKQCVAYLLAGMLTLPLLSQETGAPKTEAKPPGQPDEAQMMAMMTEMAKPGENHKLLEGFVGKWTYHVKFWMSPDPAAPPMEYSGEAVTKPIMGGRYFQSDVSGKMQMPGADGKMTDMDFKGMSIDGYSNAKKKFESSWVDNMGTGILNSEGDYDPASKAITYKAEYVEMPGKLTKMREVVKITDKNHHTFEFYEDHDGKEVKTMEISYTRK